MALPLTTQAIASALEMYVNSRAIPVEVFTDFPSDATQVSEGLYVARFYTEQRSPTSLTLQNSGSTYEVIDRLELYLIAAQTSPEVDAVLNLVDDFIDDQGFVEAGYFKREYQSEQLYRKNQEAYRTILSLTRLKTLT